MAIDDVEDISPRVQYLAANGQTVFDYPFPIFEDTDLVVDNSGVPQALGTDYTVSGAGNDSGGSVTLLVGATAGQVVTVYRDIAIQRTTDFQQNGPWKADDVNTELDRIVLVEQQLEARINRCLRIPITANVLDADIELPPAVWAGKYVTFDSNGKPTPAALVSGTITAPIIAGLLNPVTAAETAAGVVPSNLVPLPGNVLRYGAVGNGTADDTTAVSRALLVGGQASGPRVVLPAGYTFKITSYLQIQSNTAVDILGTLQLTGRNSGLFANNASNINICGYGRGKVTDTTVVANYIWNNNNFNPAVVVAPAIHLRSCTNALVEGLFISFVNQGILFSNATTTLFPIGSVVLSQASPVNCRAVSCNTQFCEMTGISSYNSIDCAYLTNYVYRCGDGGMSMFTGTDCDISGNHRVSPYSVPADVTTFGANSQAHPTTWNDEQGIELEACHGTTISGNLVRGFWGFGIDVKNGSNRILVSNNRVVDTESCSIIVREGDGVKNACHKVSIIGNTISGHGYLHRAAATSQTGAIRTGECFITEIIANVIYAYQTTVGISCLGPDTYQASYYPSDPHQGSLVVSNNCFDFKNSSFETESEIGYSSTTLSAIVINGQYDSVQCNGNKITADRYISGDARTPAAPAISLTYVSANSAFYPNIASISDNIIDNGWNGGIIVTGQTGFAQSGLKINGNAIGGLYAGNFIQLNATHYAAVTSNVLSQVGAGGQAGIQITGTSGHLVNGAVVNSNSIGGGMATAGGMGTDSLTYGVSFSFCTNSTCIGNRIVGQVTDFVQVSNCTADIITRDTSGFPRSGAGSPSGTLTSNFIGEEYFDTTAVTGGWWKASSAQATVWTKQTN